MCGIAGFCNNRIDRHALIRAMTDRMAGRTPRASGWTISPAGRWGTDAFRSWTCPLRGRSPWSPPRAARS